MGVVHASEPWPRFRIFADFSRSMRKRCVAECLAWDQVVRGVVLELWVGLGLCPYLDPTRTMQYELGQPTCCQRGINRLATQ